MRNRTWDYEPNGKFWCRHDWKVNQTVGPDWDITYGVTILCKCTKCGKLRNRRNSYIEEIPDYMIDRKVIYR